MRVRQGCRVEPDTWTCLSDNGRREKCSPLCVKIDKCILLEFICIARPGEEVLCSLVEACVAEPMTAGEDVELLGAAEQLCVAEFALLRRGHGVSSALHFLELLRS